MNKIELTPVQVLVAVAVLLALALGSVVIWRAAHTDVLYETNNNVGIRTSTPYFPLDVAGAARATAFYVGTNAGHYIVDFLGDNLAVNTTVARFGMSKFSNGFTVTYKTKPQSMVYSFDNGNVGVGTSSPAYPLQMGSGAYCSAGGVWTNASSREYKQDIEELSTEAAQEALSRLNPVKYAYKAAPKEQHVGFIAEDVPDLVATSDRKGLSAMDVVAVLTRVVKDQEKAAKEQKKVFTDQQQVVREQQDTIRQLSERLARMEMDSK